MLKTDYQTVYQAWVIFRKGKRPTRSIDEFAYNLENNITDLSAELTTGIYRHGGYQKVVLQEKKRRDLAVASVRDRVVHRLLYDYLVAIYDKTFDADVWSCRKGKGLHAGLQRTRSLLIKYPESFVWRADIAKFFDHVDHSRMIQCLNRKLPRDDPARRLCSEVIGSHSILSKQARYTYWQPDQPDFRQHLFERI